jgi:macrodomain Ter protein organizer (MatP/YcbG family)
MIICRRCHKRIHRKSLGKERVTTSITVDRRLWIRAKIYAISKGLSLSEFIESLIRQELDKKKLSNEFEFKFEE